MTNQPKITPLEYNCVIELDPVETKVGSIIMPDSKTDMDQMASTEGTLIRSGSLAFTNDRGEKWEEFPKPGDRVMIKKYAGQFRTADLSDLIRIVPDKEIVAVLG